MNQASFIRGWKELAQVTGMSTRTLQRWHYQRARLPFLKIGKNKRSHWIITLDRVLAWYQAMSNGLKNGSV